MKRLLLLVILMLNFVLINSTFASEVARNEMAKVYFFNGMDSLYLYIDNQFQNFMQEGFYHVADIEPGKHTVWYCDSKAHYLNEIEFIAGQTYYIAIYGDERHALLNQVAGSRMAEKMDQAPVLDSDDSKLKKALKNVEKSYPNILKSVRPITVTPTQEQVTSEPIEELVRVPRYTEIKIAFARNVSSAFSKEGDRVWFRVFNDVVVNGKTCIPKGTFVQGTVRTILPPDNFGVPAMIDILITDILLSENVTIPIVGRYIMSGNSKFDEVGSITSSGASGGGLLGALIASGFASRVKGTNVMVFGGESLSVWTRQETLINPGKVTETLSDIPSNNDNLEKVKAQIPPNVIYPHITGKLVEPTVAYEALYKNLEIHKIGNAITPELNDQLMEAIFPKLNPDDIPALVCAKETKGFYLQIRLYIKDSSQTSRGVFELYDSKGEFVAKVESDIVGLGSNGTTKGLIKRGCIKLLEKIKEFEPGLIHD